MATFAIGDVQGCYTELLELLEQLAFDPGTDHLWFTGDLVNRGPQSLQVLRFVKSLGDRAITVLGNHDLHLLAVAYGAQKPSRKDTLTEVLAAPDRDQLLDWLRHRPLMYREADGDIALVHAGLAPQWDLATAQGLATEVETVLRQGPAAAFLKHMYGDRPAQWKDGLSGWKRLRCITNYFTRIRFCDADGVLDLQSKGALGSQPDGTYPWFSVPMRRSRDATLVFGHWSTLRLSDDDCARHRVYPLDTGCVWGGHLTALRLEDKNLRRVGAIQHATPSGCADPRSGLVCPPDS